MSEQGADQGKVQEISDRRVTGISATVCQHPAHSGSGDDIKSCSCGRFYSARLR
jgi:hypothetical protein